MGGRTDFMNPPFTNYGGKSSSQRGVSSSLLSIQYFHTITTDDHIIIDESSELNCCVDKANLIQVLSC